MNIRYYRACFPIHTSVGQPGSGVWVTGGPDAARTLLRDRLDLTRVAVCGHSYGGATAALAAASDPAFACGIALDPWW